MEKVSENQSEQIYLKLKSTKDREEIGATLRQISSIRELEAVRDIFDKKNEVEILTNLMEIVKMDVRKNLTPLLLEGGEDQKEKTHQSLISNIN